MAVTIEEYHRFTEHLGDAFAFSSNDIRLALLSNAYTPDFDAHEAWDDVSASEITGTGYLADGEALTSKTATFDAASDWTTYDAADTVWAVASFTARYAVLYNNSPAADADKKLILLVDFGQDESPSVENFTIAWSADGVFRLRA